MCVKPITAVTYLMCFRLHRMHEMPTIVTDVAGVCQSVHLSVTRLKSATVCALYAVCRVCGGSFDAAFVKLL